MKGLKPGVWEQTLEDIKEDEGFEEYAYQDTVGVWTIGYGFTDGVKKGDRITRAEAEEYLAERVVMAVNDIRILLGASFDALDGPRQAVMINMVYNLGRTRLSAFKMTLASLKSGDYATTARQMRASKWCRQVKGRCDRLAKAMASGKYRR